METYEVRNQKIQILREEFHKNLQANLERLEALLDRQNLEERFYRFYHQSFKAYEAQADAKEIYNTLRSLSESKPGPDSFVESIYNAGQGKVFSLTSNAVWLEEVRPILDGYLHMLNFLKLAVKYGRFPNDGEWYSTGYAALLYFYDLRE